MKNIFQSLEKAFIYIVLYTLIAIVSYILEATFAHSFSAQNQLDLNAYAIAEVAKKTTTLILISFLIVLVGTMIVIKGIESSYRLALTTDKASSNLETTSPGLVMITLGCALLAFAINKSFNITTTPATIGKQTVVVQKSINSTDSLAAISGQGASVMVAGAGEPPPQLYANDIKFLKLPADKAEFEWALQLQNKIQTNHYQPTNTETARYETLGWKIDALRPK